MTPGPRWSRRSVLGLAAAVAVAGLGGDQPDDGSDVLSTTAARAAGWAVVTDHGAIGDGRSRPLSSIYGDLTAAVRDFPSARSLEDELDGVAIQALTDSGVRRIFYPAGEYLHSRAIVVRDGQRHAGTGPRSMLRCVGVRTSPLAQARAASFQVGNIHPVAMDTADPGQAWSTYALDEIRTSDRTIRVRGPLPSRLLVGDIVMVRSDNGPVPTGNGVTYDFQMWNRVASVEPASSLIDLELPVPRTIVASSTNPAVLSGPTLCVNAGLDRFLGEPWTFARDVEIDHLRLVSTGFSSRNGVWSGNFHDLVIEAEELMAFNALVGSTVARVSGTWSSRLLEVKHASAGSRISDVEGTYRHDPAVVVKPAISVGEQSYDCVLERIRCTIGPDCVSAVRALELWSPDLQFDGELRHHGSADPRQVWAIKSNGCPANPPARIRVTARVEARGGLAAYGLVGDPDPRGGDPTDVVLALRQSSNAPRPKQDVTVERGRNIQVV